MEIEEAIYAHLSTASGTALLASTRGYPLTIPQDVALPAWAYQRVSGERVQAHDGMLAHTTTIIQITCQAETYTAVKSLARAVRQELEAFKGQMGGDGGVWVHSTAVGGDLDGYGATAGGYTVRMDVTIRFRDL